MLLFSSRPRREGVPKASSAPPSSPSSSRLSSKRIFIGLLVRRGLLRAGLGTVGNSSLVIESGEGGLIGLDDGVALDAHLGGQHLVLNREGLGEQEPFLGHFVFFHLIFTGQDDDLTHERLDFRVSAQLFLARREGQPDQLAA